ncbi:MAG: FmdB family zinc ribbon protein [Longimicrobiales bacterium]
MPIYEFTCRDCGHGFDTLVRNEAVQLACPSCHGEHLERVFSVPGVSSEATRALAMRAAKKRDRHQARDRMHDQLSYEKSYDRHG